MYWADRFGLMLFWGDRKSVVGREKGKEVII
jgi:hypothetical protein